MRESFDLDRFLEGKPLAITTSGLEELRAHIVARLILFKAEPSTQLMELATAAMEERKRASRAPTPGGLAGVIQIRGTISQHASGDLSSATAGGTATDDVAKQLREFLADEEVGKIVLDIDSPGGSSYGVKELADEIYRSRGQKPIIAVANSMAASAAYWIGAAVDYFYATPGGLVGSIGVYAMHQDISKMAEDAGVKTTFIKAGKFKTIGNAFEPLSDEAIAHIQERVDDAYAQFVAGVARGRGVTEATVRNGFGEGDVVIPRKAKAEGMIDGIATFEQVMSRQYKPRATMSTSTVASGGPVDDLVIDANDDPERVISIPLYGVPVVENVGRDDEENNDPDFHQDDDETSDEAEARARWGRMRLSVFKARAADAAPTGG